MMDFLLTCNNTSKASRSTTPLKRLPKEQLLVPETHSFHLSPSPFLLNCLLSLLLRPWLLHHHHQHQPTPVHCWARHNHGRRRWRWMHHGRNLLTENIFNLKKRISLGLGRTIFPLDYLGRPLHSYSFLCNEKTTLEQTFIRFSSS